MLPAPRFALLTSLYTLGNMVDGLFQPSSRNCSLRNDSGFLCGGIVFASFKFLCIFTQWYINSSGKPKQTHAIPTLVATLSTIKLKLS